MLATSGSTATSTTAAAMATAPTPPTPPQDTAATPAPAPSASAPTTGGSGVSTGTVRLDRPAYPGKVWLDGKKLSSSSAMVSCGTHQIKVGFRRAHSIDVPCGGELGVSK
jgi:hypothetical protein